MAKLKDLAAAELTKNNDQKALEALNEKVEAAENAAANEIFKQNTVVREAKKTYASLEKNPSATLCQLINAKLEITAQESLLADMTALKTERF